MLFGSGVWLSPRGCKGFKKEQLKSLQSLQCQALRIASGAYRHTSAVAMNIETHTLSVELQIERNIQRFLIRLHASCKTQVIDSETAAIHRYSRGTTMDTPRRLLEDMPISIRTAWLDKTILGTHVENLEPIVHYPTPPWWNSAITKICSSAEEAVQYHNRRRGN